MTTPEDRRKARRAVGLYFLVTFIVLTIGVFILVDVLPQ